MNTKTPRRSGRDGIAARAFVHLHGPLALRTDSVVRHTRVPLPIDTRRNKSTTAPTVRGSQRIANAVAAICSGKVNRKTDAHAPNATLH